jgi:D-glycero-D-manno-heptose 1,7-bisphosphate phosphatase
MRAPYVLLDRDGTLIEDVPYLNDWTKVRFLPGVIDGLSKLLKRNFRLGIVSNQSGVGRGLIQFSQLLQVNSYIVDVLLSNQIELDFFYCCLHDPIGECNCRKPRIGLVQDSLLARKILQSKSFMVGNSQCDIDFANNLGVHPILLRHGGINGIERSPYHATSFNMVIKMIDQLK